MARGPDPTTRKRWERLIDQFERSALSVTDFCRQHEVSTASLYQWRRRLRNRTVGNAKTRSTQSNSPDQTACLIPVTVTGPFDCTTPVGRQRTHCGGAVLRHHLDGPDLFLVESGYQGTLVGDAYGANTGMRIRSGGAIEFAAG